jgi:minor histocompatibility antigen H13
MTPRASTSDRLFSSSILNFFSPSISNRKRHSCQAKMQGYFATVMLGYCIGLTICEIVVGTFHWAQPAMIYLVPGTLLPFIWKAHSRGELSDVWEGLKSHHRLDDAGMSHP